MKRINSFTLALLLMITLLSACKENRSPRTIKRFGSVTGLKAEKLQYYKDLHAAAWPAVLERIKASHIQNYSIYLKKIGNNYYLFSYFEYVGVDLDKDMRKMAGDPVTQRWWKETDPCQQPLHDAKENGKIWSDMEEVFHTD